MNLHNRVANVATAALTLLFMAMPAMAQHYTLTLLTTDQKPLPAMAANLHPDGNLLNSWGLARSSNSAWWVADNHAGVSSLYDGDGAPQQLVVTVPTPKDADVTEKAAPTGAVFNSSSAFLLDPKDDKTKAIFLFATEDGTISGWNPRVQPTAAVRMVNRPGKAIYKGLALAQTTNGPRLFATNFVSGEVEVFDAGFGRVRLDDDAFRNPHLDLDHWSAFGIHNVGGNIVVTYARRDRGETDERHGSGFGRVAIFDTNGRLISELQSGAFMNAPWGVALSPADFGTFSHRLLVGNFGSGNVEVFNVLTGRHEGALLNEDSMPLFVENLWSISFGSGVTGQFNELFFTSGPNDENDGLFGKISVATPTEQRGNAE